MHPFRVCEHISFVLQHQLALPASTIRNQIAMHDATLDGGVIPAPYISLRDPRFLAHSYQLQTTLTKHNVIVLHFGTGTIGQVVYLRGSMSTFRITWVGRARERRSWMLNIPFLDLTQE